MALALAAILVPRAALSQGTPPLNAVLFFPPGTTLPFLPGAPKPLTLQILNTSATPLTTARGFSDTEFFRFLRVSGPQGLGVNAAPTAHDTARVFFCLSRGGLLLNPTIPVATPEVLAPTFSVQYDIPDLGTFYPGLDVPGRYTVSAVIPFSSFDQSYPNAFITDCDQFPAQPVVNVGPGPVAGRQDFSLVSNTVEFFLCCFTFVGFAQPVGSEVTCSASPCLTSNFGNTIPVKFQLFLNNVVVSNAVALISVKQITGTPPPSPPGDLGQGSVPTNQFRFDASGQQYVFNLDTGVLAPGIWQFIVNINDGSTHTVEIQLR